MSQGAVLGDTDCGGCKEGLDGGFGAQGGHRALARLGWAAGRSGKSESASSDGTKRVGARCTPSTFCTPST